MAEFPQKKRFSLGVFVSMGAFKSEGQVQDKEMRTTCVPHMCVFTTKIWPALSKNVAEKKNKAKISQILFFGLRKINIQLFEEYYKKKKQINNLKI